MTIPRRFRRRDRPRHAAGWLGRYGIEDRSDDARYPCRVLDVSPRGAGLELLGAPPQVGDVLLVELQVAAPSMVGTPLRAAVRYVGPGCEGGLAVGIEFLELDAAGQCFVRLLIAVQSA